MEAGSGASPQAHGAAAGKAKESQPSSPQGNLRCGKLIVHKRQQSYPPTPSTPRLLRLSGRVKPDTVSFEFKMAGLLALRAQNAGMVFVSNTNVAAAKPMDDVVLRVSERTPPEGADEARSATVFMQLHHAGRDLALADFTEKNKFHLPQYFEFYRKYKKNHADQHDHGPSELIYDCDLKNVYFIFYTPRKRTEGLPHPIKFDTNDFFFEVSEMLTTVQGGEIFRFSEQDMEVWTMYKNSPELEQEYHEFLSKLYVFSSQAKSTNLFTLIQMEFDLKFNGPVPSSITPRFIKFLEEWATDGKQDYCLANDSYTLEWIIALHSQDIAKEAIQDIRFKNDEKLREFVRKHSRMIVTVPRVARRSRIAKLIRILEEVFGDRWVYLDKIFYSRYPGEAVKCMCDWHYCKMYVVNFNDLRKQNKILEYLEAAENVIILNSERYTALEMPVGEWDQYTDEWKVDQLVEECKVDMMERKLLFQGKEMVFKDLVTAWPILNKMDVAKLLSDMVRDEAALGKEIAWEDILLPRTLVHRTVLDARVLKILPNTDHLVLSGFPPHVLEEVGRDLGVENLETNDRWTVIKSDCEAEAKDLFEHVFTERTQRADRYVHWLDCVAGDTLEEVLIIWRATRGLTNELEGCIKRANDSCTNEPWCAHEPSEEDNCLAECAAAAWGAPRALLVGDAGSGKSTFLRRAAAAAQELHATSWVVFVRVLEHLPLLREFPHPEKLTVDHVVQLLAAAAGVAVADNSVEWRCFREAVTAVGDVRVFVDGLDEVCPAHEDKILRILHLLQRKTKVAQIWVATRHEMERPLSRVLRCAAVHLQPLSRDQQQMYLCKYWGTRHFVPTAKFTDFAAAVVNTTSPSSGVKTKESPIKSRSLLDIPLHLQMAAELFSPDAVASLSATGGSLDKRASTLLKLHRKIVERKQDMCMERHGLKAANFENSTFSKDDEFYTRHQISAMYVMPLKQSYKGPHKKSFEKYLIRKRAVMKREKAGIFWVQENWVPVFIHPSFAEYFAAMWLHSKAGNRVMKDFLNHIDGERRVETIKEFLKGFQE